MTLRVNEKSKNLRQGRRLFEIEPREHMRDGFRLRLLIEGSRSDRARFSCSDEHEPRTRSTQSASPA
jgi:hypothetical protein